MSAINTHDMTLSVGYTPLWVRMVAPLKSRCWACNIWRGIIVGACCTSALIGVVLLLLGALPQA